MTAWSNNSMEKLRRLQELQWDVAEGISQGCCACSCSRKKAEVGWLYAAWSAFPISACLIALRSGAGSPSPGSKCLDYAWMRCMTAEWANGMGWSAELSAMDAGLGWDRHHGKKSLSRGKSESCSCLQYISIDQHQTVQYEMSSPRDVSVPSAAVPVIFWALI